MNMVSKNTPVIQTRIYSYLFYWSMTIYIRNKTFLELTGQCQDFDTELYYYGWPLKYG